MSAASIAEILEEGYRGGEITIAEAKAFIKTHGACFSVWPEPDLYDIDNPDEISRIKWQTMHEFDDLSAVLIIEPDYLRVLAGNQSRFHANEDPSITLDRVQIALEAIQLLRHQ